MDTLQLYLPDLKVAYGKLGQYQRFQQPRKKDGTFKRKGIEREKSFSESDPGSRASQQNQKPKWMKRIKTAFRRTLSHKGRGQPASISREGSTLHGKALGPHAQGLLPRIVRELTSPKLFTKPRVEERTQNATIQLDVVEAETEEITQGNTLLRAKRTTKRLSVTSLPSGMQKVDDLKETLSDKSMKLLAQRLAELQQCELLGDEILQSSKQFQKISKRTVWKYKLKNMCCPCTCCF
ncbi:putative uncharacterized protein C3orf49 homolog isoform X2 [Marmota monax]|uniref:putative uncharacterized protein C3orf49 homolog isoform X2 n=1 Tax=Marmota monax TaxID=9995 RepID=UPI001EAFE6F8|nr:putative uncharacterized protein C3orf49 homolog isoform X2 [Marmota monax]